LTVIRSKSRLGSRGRPEEARASILEAALREFAQEGVAGARTEAIARAAGVNKALLYYYYGDKESLYGAVLDKVFSGLADKVNAVLDRDLPPREKVLAWVGAHFDYVASSRLYPRVVQREMMRAGRAGSPHMRRLAERYLRPLQMRLMALIHGGIATGDFREIDAMHFILSTIAMVVSYFTMTPMIEIMTHSDPLSEVRIRERRAAVLDLVAAALFRPGEHARSRGGR
jgi:TetR/AcrR family transcriptional regulator